MENCATSVVEAFGRVLLTITNHMQLAEKLQTAMCLIFGHDPDGLLEKFKGKPRVCGKIWNSGTMAYRCRDCQITVNSCICIDCFVAGNHRGHDYALYSSAYGGCCDCGDPAAWKPSGFCSHHPGISPEIYVPPGVEDVLVRAHDVVGAIFRLLEHTVRAYIRQPTDDEKSAIMVVLLSWIRRFCQCGEALRRVACEVSMAPAAVGADEVFGPPAAGTTQYMIVDELLRATCVIDEQMSLELTNMLLELLYDPRYKQQFARVYVHTYPYFLQVSMRPEEGRDSIVGQAMNTIGAQLFNIEELVDQLVRHDRFLQTLLECVSLVLHRTAKERPGPGIAGTPNTPMADCGNELVRGDTVSRYLQDIHAALKYAPLAGYVVQHCSDVFAQVIELYSLVQNCGQQIRQQQQHVEYEDDTWRYSFFIDLRLLNTMSVPLGRGMRALLRPWVGRPIGDVAVKEAVLARLQAIVTAIVTLLKQELGAALPWRPSPWGSPWPLLQYKVSQQPVSFHLPLHRLVAALLHPIAKLDPPGTAAISGIQSGLQQVLLAPETLALLAEQPLRVWVWQGQIRAGHWRRNGEGTMHGQIMLYRKSAFFYDAVELDLFCLQVVAAAIGPERFLEMALDRFELLDWFVAGREGGSTDHAALRVDVDTDSTKVAEELLRMLIQLVSDRIRAGPEDSLKRHVVALLALDDMAYSVLSQRIKAHWAQHKSKELEAALREVADFAAGADTAAATGQTGSVTAGAGVPQGKFSLKRSYWDEVDPYFLHYTWGDIERLSERWTEHTMRTARREGRTVAKEILPIRPLRPTWDMLRGVVEVLNAPTLHAMVMTVLYNAAMATTAPSDNLLDGALHLLKLAIDHCPSVSTAAQPPSAMSPLHVRTVPDLRTAVAALSSTHGILSYAYQPLIATNTTHPPQTLVTLLGRLLARPEYGDRHGLVQQLLRAIGAKAPSLCTAVEQALPRQESEEERRRREAKRRQAEIMAQFRQREQEFMHKAREDPTLYAAMDDDNAGEHAEAIDQPRDAVETCALCREPGSADRPLGLVAFAERSRTLAVARESAMRERGQPVSPNDDNEAQQYLAHVRQPPPQPPTPLSRESLAMQLGPMADEQFIEHLLGMLRAQQAAVVLSVLETTEAAMPVDSGDNERLRQVAIAEQVERPLSHGTAMVVHSCGHAVHIECHHQYLSARTIHLTSEELLLSRYEIEFWCPLCKRIANILLPYIRRDPPITTSVPVPAFDEWLKSLLATADMPQSHTAAPPVERLHGEPLSDLLPRLTPFARHLQRVHQYDFSLAPHPPQHPAGVVLFLTRTLAYDVAAAELSLRVPQPAPTSTAATAAAGFMDADAGVAYLEGEFRSVERLSNIQQRTLRELFKVVECHIDCIRAIHTSPDVIGQLTAYFVRTLAGGPVPYGRNTPLLQLDQWLVLVNLLLLTKRVAGTEPRSERETRVFHLLAVVFRAVAAQAMAALVAADADAAAATQPTTVDVSTRTGPLVAAYQMLCRKAGRSISENAVDENALETRFQSLVLPFLRKCAILTSACLGFPLTTTASPEVPMAVDTVSTEEALPPSEYEWLCMVLRLPPRPSGAVESIASSTLNTLTEVWIEQYLTHTLHRDGTATTAALPMPPLEEARPFRLVGLPALFQDLFHQFYERACERCGTVPSTHAMCLLCGTMVCANGDCCRQPANQPGAGAGEAFRHAVQCGGGNGVFLMLKTPLVLLMRPTRCACWGSPYLDVYGEEDLFLERGRALYLSPALCSRLAQIFASHELEAEILRPNVPRYKRAQKPSWKW